jgi:prophage maintenance system killer protein
MEEQNQIRIYQTEDGLIQIDVLVDYETVWLKQSDIVKLFNSSKANISEHISNIFKEGELSKNSVVRKFRTTASDNKQYQITHYNLDVIISVGYRVKSKRGTQFRIWANKILKEFILQGYSLNEKILKEKESELNNLKYSIGLIQKLTKSQFLSEDEVLSLINVITRYTKALDILDQYDHQSIQVKNSITEDKYSLIYSDALKVILHLKEKFKSSELFGKEKDQSFMSSISTIYQTFDGKELYPGVELKAANLLYFLVKNHSFIDGNKRIAASIFLWFLFKNGILYDNDNKKIIDDTALVGITLMIAESNPKEKDLIINVLMNLLVK